MDSWSAFLISAAFFFISGALLSIIFLYFVQKTAKPARKARPQYHPPDTRPAPKSGLMRRVDQMDKAAFEAFCASLLEQFGYENVRITKSASGRGVDIIAINHGLRYAFQCRRGSSQIGNAAIQEVHTGMLLYSCSMGVVITNNYFTAGAVQAAEAAGVELWDRDVLMDKLGGIAP